MQKIVLPIELTPLHWIIAYATALIYVLLTVQEFKDKKQDKAYSFGDYLKKHWASTLATAIMLPVILLIAAENFADILPINNVTAALAGWQTNSAFRKIMGAGAQKFIKKEEAQV